MVEEKLTNALLFPCSFGFLDKICEESNSGLGGSLIIILYNTHNIARSCFVLRYVLTLIKILLMYLH